MRVLVFAAVALFSHGALAEGRYLPPAASAAALAGIDFDGKAIGGKFRARFSECDTRNTCDGKSLKYNRGADPNRNSTLLQLTNGAIFYDGKMGLDADGSALSRKTPGPTDQAATSLRYPLAGKPSLDADRVPYVVIPLGGFDKALGVRLGDVAAVVHGGKRVFAVIADRGPSCKIGEGSMQLHELLGHPVCASRADNGDCLKLRNAGIGGDVLYFLFPGTRKDIYPGLTPENINARIEAVGARAWAALQAR